MIRNAARGSGTPHVLINNLVVVNPLHIQTNDCSGTVLILFKLLELKIKGYDWVL